MKIAIIGMGHVGKNMRDLFAPHAGLVTFDQADGTDYPHGELSSCDFAVVCVDTPPGPGGEGDITNVTDAVSRLPVDRILLKSTVPPGTTDLLSDTTGKQICFSPEYVGESSYYNPYCTDAASVPFVVLGGPPEIRRWFIDALLPVLGPVKTYFQCTAVEAEIIKYMENSFFATKIAFVNEFWEICRRLGADFHSVREGWLLDPRVEPSHTAVFAEQRGFGGKCLPKDLSAIVAAARQAGYVPALLEQVITSNQRFRTSA